MIGERMLKFRAYDRQEKWVMEGEELRNIFGFFDISAYPDRYVVMQWTGLKDCNDVEIYEGDIIKPDYAYGVVYWNDLKGCWSVQSVEHHKWQGDLWHYVSYAPVVGNLYENSDLVQG